MKKILILLISTISTSIAHAGGSVGGGGGSSLVAGDTIIEPSEFIKTAEGGLALDKYKLLDVIAESMGRNKNLELNGEAMAADRYDFKTGRLSLRSLSKPSRIITIETASPNSETTE